MTTPASINWKVIEKIGLYGVLSYFIVTSYIRTSDSNTVFFQTKFTTSLETCAAALSTAATEMKRKDDALEENAKAMERFTHSMDQLSERIQRLLTRGWENISSSNTTAKPPFVATPVSVSQ